MIGFQHGKRNENHESRRAGTNGHELVLKHEVYEIVGSAIDVLNELVHGLLEKPYENALVVEFHLRGIPTTQQPRYAVTYKGVRVGYYIPDLIVHGTVVVDTKVIDAITDHDIGQMMNYLRVTGLRVGVILNFRRARLEWKRVIL